jgi:hypothetical protein
MQRLSETTTKRKKSREKERETEETRDETVSKRGLARVE